MTKEEVMALFIDDVAARKKAVRDFLADKNNSYEDRKEVYLNTPPHLQNTSQWILSLDEFENKHYEISWSDHFYFERYSVVDLVDLCKDMGEDGNFLKEEHDDFVRACVNSGYHSFTFDW
jgi:hypothetical protein